MHGAKTDLQRLSLATPVADALHDRFGRGCQRLGAGQARRQRRVETGTIKASGLAGGRRRFFLLRVALAFRRIKLSERNGLHNKSKSNVGQFTSKRYSINYELIQSANVEITYRTAWQVAVQ